MDNLLALHFKLSARHLLEMLESFLPFSTGVFLEIVCREKPHNIKGLKKAICRKVKNLKEMKTS